MKKSMKLLTLLSSIMLLASCGMHFDDSSDPTSSENSQVDSSENNSQTESSENSSQTESSEDSSQSESSEDIPTDDPYVSNNQYGLLKDPQNGVILHAWNWSLKNIKAKLPEIAAAGYSTVQTSPIQPEKDYRPNKHWRGNWWQLYQPYGFSIAKAGESNIGTADELRELCAEADKYGIKIIVDVVANHLANAGGGSQEIVLNPKVREYEPEIYDNNLLHQGYGEVNDNDGESIVKGHIHLPDLQTENEIVRDRVGDLLVDYIACGVDGFRFDAAKHIETPSDGEFGSEFWPSVLGRADEKAYSMNEPHPYYYGEIVKTVGEGRSYRSYTSMMSVTDTTASSKGLHAASSGVISPLTTDDFLKEDIKSNKAVLWAESHDTFANRGGESEGKDQYTINKAYAMQASRNKSTSLFLARPDNNSNIGDVGTLSWKDKEVVETNKFHNEFVYSNEEMIYEDNGFYVNLRHKGNKAGMMIVSGSTNTDVMLSANGLKNGTYTDLVSNNTFTVGEGKIVGQMDKSGIAILKGDKADLKPLITVSHVGDVTKPTNIRITVKNATESYYKLNGGEKVKFNGTANVTVGLNPVDELTVTASKGKHNVIKKFTYNLVELSELDIKCINIPEEKITGNTLVAWVWKDNQDGHWETGEVKDNSFVFTRKKEDNKFLLVSFKGKNISPDWNKEHTQTHDITIEDKQIFDVGPSQWKN